MTLILLAISATIIFCIIAWHLAIYALPVMVGITAFQWLLEADAGFILSAIGAACMALFSIVLVMVVIGLARNPYLRLIALGVFVIPSLIAGYALVYGITKSALDPGIALILLSSIGGIVIGVASIVNLGTFGSIKA